MEKIEALAHEAWQENEEIPTIAAYAEVWYQPVGWSKAYRYLVKRERQKS